MDAQDAARRRQVIETQTCYIPACDECRMRLEWDYEAHFETERAALQNALDSDWVERPTGLFCIDCARNVPDLRTSEQWQAHLRDEFTVLDPDGWDRADYEYSWKSEIVTEAEFRNRAARSTCKPGRDWRKSLGEPVAAPEGGEL